MILTEEDCETELDLGEIVCPRVPSLFDNDDFSCNLFSTWGNFPSIFIVTVFMIEILLGTRISSCSDLRTQDQLLIVPTDRLFMMPGHHIGFRLPLHHIGMPTDDPIELETLSINPRIFRVKNFISSDEAQALLENALEITS